MRTVPVVNIGDTNYSMRTVWIADTLRILKRVSWSGPLSPFD
jgi:hypothetical protein